MTTYIGGGQVTNPYFDSVTGGMIPGGVDYGQHGIRVPVGKFMDELEPTATPILTAIGRGGTVNQLKYEWGLERQQPHKVTLNANITNNATTLDLGTTDIKKVQKYMVFRFIDPTNGDELVWSNADPNLSAGTIGIVRAQGGTGSVAGTTGYAHTTTTTASLEIVGLAEPVTGVDHAISPYTYGDMFWNTIQRYGGGPKMDDVARWTPNQEASGDQLLRLIRKEAVRQKILMEKNLIHGGRQTGNVSGPQPPTFGGIRYFLGTADSNANVRTVSGLLSVYDFDEVISTVWGKYTSNVARRVLCNMKTRRILGRLLMPFKEGRLTDTSINLTFDKFTLESGEVTFFDPHPWMPDGEIWGLDFDGMELVTYAGEGNGDWHVDVNASSGSYEWRTLTGVFGFRFEGEPRCWRITGFDTDLANYATVAI
jgi:hypothetical protein